MPKRPKPDEGSLFDFMGPEETSGIQPAIAPSTESSGFNSPPAPPTESDWQEVPQARFLSWSDPMQLSYCAARDMDSAEQEENPYWIEFYLRRAESYRHER